MTGPKGVPGTPPIVEIIFNKISKCAIFVPDLTFVGKSDKNRLLPNPNVLIEYGWALRELSYSRIIAVMNSAFGEPTDASMPFNMRHLRNPITYHLDETIDEKERMQIKENLVSDLYNALGAIVKSGILTQLNEKQNDFDGVPSTSNPSTFFQPGETFIDNRALRTGTQTLIIPDVPRLFLRIIPQKPLDGIKSNRIACDLDRTGNLFPMSGGDISYSFGRNKYGAYACSSEDGKVLNFTQLFNNGELWGIDAYLIDKNRLMERANVDFGFFPFGAFEKIFVVTIGHYLKFARDILKLPMPLKFIAGATDVLGYRMAVRGTKVLGNVVEDHITFEGIIEDYLQEPRIILRSFFEHVWEECGLERPEADRLS